MKSMCKKDKPPMGIKIIAILTSINFFWGLGMSCIFLIRPDKFSIFIQPLQFPLWFVEAVTLSTAIFFGWTAIGLWRLQNWARRVTVGLSCVIFLNILRLLVKYNIFPNPKNWWHFYLYPLVLWYLVLPKIRDKFKKKNDNSTHLSSIKS